MSKSKTRRRTASQRARLVEEWEASGQSAAAFAEGQDFSGASLYSWRSRLRARRGAQGGDGAGGTGVDFVPVVLEPRSESEAATSWQLDTASGLSVSMTGPEALRGLEVVLRVLGDGVMP